MQSAAETIGGALFFFRTCLFAFTRRLGLRRPLAWSSKRLAREAQSSANETRRALVDMLRYFAENLILAKSIRIPSAPEGEAAEGFEQEIQARLGLDALLQ